LPRAAFLLETHHVKRKLTILGVLLPFILIADIVTKRWALATLEMGVPNTDIIGSYVPLTLAFNRGAAFGISIGDNPAWFFIPVALLALGLMIVLLIRSLDNDHTRIISLALVISGALGNLFDRIRWDRGVVDFIGPIDLGFTHWPIFNIADMAISCGAVLLAISFWQEERQLARARKADGSGMGVAPEPTEG